MRKNYDTDLKEMRDDVIQMSEITLKMLDHCADTLFEEQPISVEKMEKMEKKLEKIEKGIEKTAASVIALQQPVAKDMREITSAARIAISWNRIGSHIADIYEYADPCPRKIKNNPEELEILKNLRVVMTEMLKGAAEAYKSRDVEKAIAVAQMDDEIDLIFKNIRKNIMDEEDAASYSLCSLMIAGHIERIGDHIANICERVVYLERCELVKLN